MSATSLVGQEAHTVAGVFPPKENCGDLLLLSNSQTCAVVLTAAATRHSTSPGGMRLFCIWELAPLTPSPILLTP